MRRIIATRNTGKTVSLMRQAILSDAKFASRNIEYAKSLGWEQPQIVLHLDHGDSFETCKECVDTGFSSVMIDGSHLPYEENIALTKKVVEYALALGMAANCEINRYCRFDRKNYFYPDNPQNYQISQLYLPICHDGHLEITTENGKKTMTMAIHVHHGLMDGYHMGEFLTLFQQLMNE